MPSTTAELALVREPADSPSRFVSGCRVLLNLFASSLPSNLADERLALQALRILSMGWREEPAPADLEAENDVRRALEQLGSDRAEAALAATAPLKGLRGWFRNGEQRRRVRGRLLFTIAVYVGGTLLKFQAPSTLIANGIVGGPAQTNRLLRWIGSGIPTPGERELHRDYLDLARDAFLNDSAVYEPQDARAFTREPWIRQLLVLERHWNLWKATSIGASAAQGYPGLALESGTLEFDLARLHAFSALRRSSGPVGRESLNRMGYVDYQPRGLRWPWRLVVLTVIMAGLGMAAFSIYRQRVRAWDKKNGETVNVLRTHAAAETAPTAGAVR